MANDKKGNDMIKAMAKAVIKATVDAMPKHLVWELRVVAAFSQALIELGYETAEREKIIVAANRIFNAARAAARDNGKAQ